MAGTKQPPLASRMPGRLAIWAPGTARTTADLYENLKAALATLPEGSGWPEPPVDLFIWNEKSPGGLPLLDVAATAIRLLGLEEPETIYLSRASVGHECLVVVFGRSNEGESHRE